MHSSFQYNCLSLMENFPNERTMFALMANTAANRTVRSTTMDAPRFHLTKLPTMKYQSFAHSSAVQYVDIGQTARPVMMCHPACSYTVPLPKGDTQFSHKAFVYFVYLLIIIQFFSLQPSPFHFSLDENSFISKFTWSSKALFVVSFADLCIKNTSDRLFI